MWQKPWAFPSNCTNIVRYAYFGKTWWNSFGCHHSAWGHQSVVLPPGRIAIALAYWIPVLFGADVLFCIASDRDLAVTTNKQLCSPHVGEFHSEIAVRQEVNGIRELWLKAFEKKGYLGSVHIIFTIHHSLSTLHPTGWINLLRFMYIIYIYTMRLTVNIYVVRIKIDHIIHIIFLMNIYVYIYYRY